MIRPTDSYLRNLDDSISCGNPSIESSVERPYLLEAIVHEYSGDARRGRLAGAGAIKDDVSIAP
jgi:hypothetical protein